MNDSTDTRDSNQPAVNRPWLLWCTLALSVTLAVAVYPFDLDLSRYLGQDQESVLPGDLRRLIGLSEFFAHGLGVLIILIGIWVLVPAQRIRIPRIGTSAYLAGLLATFCKYLLPRQRPIALDPIMDDVQLTWAYQRPAGTLDVAVLNEYGWLSFPSGHAATTVGLAFAMSCVFPRGRWYFAILAGLACLQRVESLAHWPSDVLTGVCFGIVIGMLVNSGGSPVGRWFLKRETDYLARTAKRLETGETGEPAL